MHYLKEYERCTLDIEHPVKRRLLYRCNKKKTSEFFKEEMWGKTAYLSHTCLLFFLAYLGVLLYEYHVSQSYFMSLGGPLLMLIVASTIQFIWSLGILFEVKRQSQRSDR